MILALAKAITSLFSPGRSGLSRQSRGQRSPFSVYACAVGIKLVSTLRQTTANYRGCPAHKDQAFRQHVVHNQISYASTVKQAHLHPPTTHLISPPKKIVSPVTNVVIQIAQAQLCIKCKDTSSISYILYNIFC